MKNKCQFKNEIQMAVIKTACYVSMSINTYQWDKSGMQSKAKKMAQWLRAHTDLVEDLS